MLNPLLRLPRGEQASPPVFPSAQVYRWPMKMERAVRIAPALATVLCFLGLYSLAVGLEEKRFEGVVGGLLELVLGLSVAIAVVMLHIMAAREIRLTRDSLVIRQTGRRELSLPYCAYHHDWVADLSNPRAIRVIVFGLNRGCMVLLPPPWLMGALQEVRRIQEVEGWYAPNCDDEDEE